jgi:hypothetical protein
VPIGTKPECLRLLMLAPSPPWPGNITPGSEAHCLSWVNSGMIAGKNESNPPDDMKLKKLRKKVQRIYADTLKLKADLKALKRRAKSKGASDIESPPAT